MEFVKLVKGKILDAQPGFVDSWNRMVDCWNNLAGSGIASVSWKDERHPVVNVDTSESSGNDDDDDDYEDNFHDITIPQLDPEQTDSTFFGVFKIGANNALENRYYRVGGRTYEAAAHTLVVNRINCLVISADGASPSSSYADYATIAALQAAEADTSKYILPLYTLDANGNVTCDWRNALTAAMGEFAQ